LTLRQGQALLSWGCSTRCHGIPRAPYWVFAGGLRSASTATVVDGQGETPVMTDGPYLETKEVIGGFWVIDAPDLDVALKLAAEGRPFGGLA
jgi:hypothetical protein